jgi:transcription initiation factor IIE alpha subunit
MNFIRFLTNRELNDILLKLHDEGVIQIERRGEKQMYIRSMTRKGRSKK